MAKVVGFSIEIKGQKEILNTTKVLGLLNTQLILINNSLKEIDKNAGKGLNKLAKDFSKTADSAKKLGSVAKSSFQTFEEGNKIVTDLGNGYFEVNEEIEKTAEEFEDLADVQEEGAKSIQDLIDRNKELKEILKEAPLEGEEGYEELADTLDTLKKEFADNRDTILEFNKELRTGTVQSDIQAGSIVDLRNTVKELTKEYNLLSPAQREATEGAQIKENLASTVEELKKLEEEVGNNTRSVGDYKKAFEGFGGALGPVKGAILGVSGAFKLLIANPIVAVISAIVAGLTALFGAFTSTKEGAEFLGRATAALSATFDVIRDLAVTLGGALVSVFRDPIGSVKSFGKAIKDTFLNVFGGIINLVTATGRSLGALLTLDFDKFKTEAANAAQVIKNGFNAVAESASSATDAINSTTDEIIREAEEAARLTGVLQDLDDVQRDLSVSRAQLNAELTKTRAASRDENLSLEERINALNEVRSAEQTQLNAELAAQARRVQALKALAAQSDSDKQTLDEIAQAEISLANIRQQSASKEISIQRELDRLNNQRRKEAQKRLDEEDKRLKKLEKDRQSLLTQLQKESLARIKIAEDLSQRLRELQIQEIEDTTQRVLAAEQNRFEVESFQRQRNFNQRVKEVKEQEARLIELFGETSEEVAQFQNSSDQELQALKDVNDKIAEQKEQQHQDNLLKIQKDAKEKEQEDNQKFFEEEDARLQAEFDAEAEADDERVRAGIERDKNALKEKESRFNETLNLIQQSSDTFFDAIGQLTEAANDAETKRLDQAIANREESINNLNEKLQNATGLQKKFLERQVEQEQEALAEEQKAREKAEKERVKSAQNLALIQAIINGAVAITRAFSDLGPIAGAITAVGVAAGIAAQIATIANQQFADGGVLSGPSHAAGGVPVSVGGVGMVEAEGGEAIINKRSTSMFKPLLSAINQAGGGVKFENGGLLGSSIPAPSVGSISSNSNGDIASFLSAFDSRTQAISRRIDNITVTQDLNNLQDIQDNDNNLDVLTTLN